jgi:hypothetical protein
VKAGRKGVRVKKGQVKREGGSSKQQRAEGSGDDAACLWPSYCSAAVVEVVQAFTWMA